MDEEDFDYKKLKQQTLNELYDIFNIDDVLCAREKEIKKIKENFKQTWDNYNVVNSVRKEYVNSLYILRLKIFLTFFLQSIISNDFGLEIDNLNNRIKESSNKIKKQKSILILIKKALKDLESKMVPDCNYDINELLQLLYDQDITIIKNIYQKMQETESKLSKINIQSPKNHEKELEDIDEKINMYVLKLGLK